jgi:zinc transport system substrate-binding protein
MKNKYIFTLVLLLGILVVSLGLTAVYVSRESNPQDDGELLVVTSFYPMYIAAENIIGDTEGVKLENLSEPQTGCLHDFQLTPEDMRLLSQADVFVINGGGIETFMEDVAAAYPELLVVNACENVELSGDNAHAWMSIKAYKKQVDTIAEKLMDCDPDNALTYQANRDSYEEKLEKLQMEQEELTKSLSGEPVILFHEAYEYLAEDLGLDSRYLLNLDEETAVSAGDVAAVLEEIQANNIRLILAEELYGSDMGTLISSEADVQVLYLDTLNRGDYSADSYLDGMQKNLDMIRAWIQEGK